MAWPPNLIKRSGLFSESVCRIFTILKPGTDLAEPDNSSPVPEKTKQGTENFSLILLAIRPPSPTNQFDL